MVVLVAENALQFCMFTRAADQRVGEVAVAGSAVYVGFILVILDIQRLVHLVTGHAVGKGLSFTVRFMTFHTVGNIAVFIMMTDCTVKTTMGTGVVFYFIDLGRVTSIADGNVVFTKNNSERLVWILMTTEAGCFYFKVGLSFMAFGTLGDNLFLRGSGGMATFMAIKTAYLGFMTGSIVLILVDNFRMTFYTIADFQHRIRSQGASC